MNSIKNNYLWLSILCVLTILLFQCKEDDSAEPEDQDIVSSVTDCNGDVDGTAFIDSCGTCVGGNTEEVSCCSKSINIDFESLITNWSANKTVTKTKNLLSIQGTTHDEWDEVRFELPKNVNIKESSKVFIKVRKTKDSNAGTLNFYLRDKKEVGTLNDNTSGSTNADKTKSTITLGTTFEEFEIDFTGNTFDAWNEKCKGCQVDLENIKYLILETNSGYKTYPDKNYNNELINSAFNGTVEIEYIQLQYKKCE